LSQCSNRLFPIPLAGLCRSNEYGLVIGIDNACVFSDVGLFQQGLGTIVGGDRFEMTESVAHELDRGGFDHQRFGAFVGEDHGDCVEHDRRRSCQLSVSCQHGATNFAPPTLGATIVTVAPAAVAAWLIFLTAAPSEPSATRMPIARPSSVSFILPMICNAGEGSRSSTGAAATGASGIFSRPRPLATRWARSSWIWRRCPTMASRMCRCSTLESSNTRAEAMCACSCVVWLR